MGQGLPFAGTRPGSNSAKRESGSAIIDERGSTPGGRNPSPGDSIVSRHTSLPCPEVPSRPMRCSLVNVGYYEHVVAGSQFSGKGESRGLPPDQLTHLIRKRSSAGNLFSGLANSKVHRHWQGCPALSRRSCPKK